VAVNCDRGVVYVLMWYIVVMCCSMVGPRRGLKLSPRSSVCFNVVFCCNVL